MFGKKNKGQAGFALLIFLVILMGLGGIALTGVTQNALKQVEDKKFKHNVRVLKEAKQALLQFAYNYPELDTTGFVNGPGRLPCADIDNDGLQDTAGVCAVLGRLPWRQNNLNLSDLRDADGERLWYAVSSTFDTNTGGVAINSDTSGTITIRDQSGSIIYNGLNPGAVSKYGVAAIIIAPGAITSRNGIAQNRVITNGIDNAFDIAADSDIAIVSATNYLDQLVGVEDNSNFTHSSATDGFVLGPVNGQSADAVNDQLIIITAAEVIEMAEKATLQAYRDSINTYLINTGANNYPWLFDYDLDDLDTFPGLATAVSAYPLGSLTNIGRIPSIFSSYFNEENSEPIDSEIRLIVTKNFELSGLPFSITFDQQSSILANMNFEDTGTSTDNQASLKADAGLFTYQNIMYLSETFFSSGIWEVCQNDADNLSDCNRDGGGAFTAGPNTYNTRVTLVGIELDFTSNIDIDLDYSIVPVFNYLPALAFPDTHAEIQATFPSVGVSGIVGRFFWDTGEYDPLGVITSLFNDEQPLDSNIDQGLITNLSTGNITIGVRYFPELPNWAHSTENDWHNSIQMAYSSVFRPGVGAVFCIPGTDCLTVNNSAGISNDKTALLVLSSDHDLIDDDNALPIPAVAGYADELDDIFEGENNNSDNIFDANPVNGDDKILIIR